MSLISKRGGRTYLDQNALAAQLDMDDAWKRQAQNQTGPYYIGKHHAPAPAGKSASTMRCHNNAKAEFSSLNFLVPATGAATGFLGNTIFTHTPVSANLMANGLGLAAGLVVNYLAMTNMAFYDNGWTAPSWSNSLSRAWDTHSTGNMCVSGTHFGPVKVGADNLAQAVVGGMVMYMMTGSMKHALVNVASTSVGGVALSSYLNS